VVHHPLASGVVVEPAPQAGPGAGHGLVGELDARLVGGHEAGSHEVVEHETSFGVGVEATPIEVGSHRLAAGGRHDQAQQQRPQALLLGGGQAGVELLGRTGDGTTDLAGGPVAVDGEHPPVAALPRLGERVGQQRQGGGLSLDLAHQ
jgi:hypothetical protein